MFGFFKKSKPEKKEKGLQKRRFIGAGIKHHNRFAASYNKINADLKQDYIALVTRARSLVQNNEMVNSFINLMLRSTLGHTGFIFNSTVLNDDGSPDIIANSIIEKHWKEYNGFKKYVSACGQMGGLDLDRQCLFNFLVDGEIFIHKVKDSSSPYGIRWEVIDSLNIDTLYNAENPSTGEKICMGIKVDEHFKPISYFIRKNRTSDYYLQGDRIEVPASEIIHVYKKMFPDQVRGITCLAPVLLTLNSIQQFKRAEVNSAILNSLFMGVWVRNGSGFENFDESEVDEFGDIATQLESGVFRFAPPNHTLQQISSNHPSGNVGSFFKSMLKGCSGCLGLSYNKLASDYESVNYSSLRAASLEEDITIKEMQRFFIDNWKEYQFSEFLKYLLLSDLTNLPYSKIEKFMSHQFHGKNSEFLDPQKSLAAIQLRLQLGLSSPIQEIQALGKEPQQVLDSIKKFKEMCAARGLKFTEATALVEEVPEVPVDEVEEVKEEKEQE